jgi:hypothetical protein
VISFFFVLVTHELGFSKFFPIAKRRKMALEKCAKLSTLDVFRGFRCKLDRFISRTFRAPFFDVLQWGKNSKIVTLSTNQSRERKTVSHKSEIMAEAEAEPERDTELMRAMFRQVRGPDVGGVPACSDCGKYEPTCECSFREWLPTVTDAAVAEFKVWRADVERITNSERRKRAKMNSSVDDDDALVWGRGFN